VREVDGRQEKCPGGVAEDVKVSESWCSGTEDPRESMPKHFKTVESIFFRLENIQEL
jgi:hypothetical protein